LEDVESRGGWVKDVAVGGDLADDYLAAKLSQIQGRKMTDIKMKIQDSKEAAEAALRASYAKK